MSRDNYEIILPKLIEKKIFLLDKLGDAYIVNSNCEFRIRKAVYTIAKYFRREFGYDFIQYDEYEEDDNNCHAYLWTLNSGYEEFAIGACCFRFRKYEDHPSGWALQWIWLHPYERGKSILTSHWDLFENKYGNDFHVEPPLSHAMKGFLQTRNFDLHTKGYIKNDI